MWEGNTDNTCDGKASISAEVLPFEKGENEMKQEFLKNDDGKPTYELLPFELLSEVNLVLVHGREKYGECNWMKQKGFKLSRCYNALLRHMFAWWIRREDKDPETGLSHLSHALCNLLFLMYHFKHNKNADDRPQLKDK